MNALLTQEQLKNTLDYNAENGIFTWRSGARRNIKGGTIAGWTNTDGYRQIEINNKAYMASRLAWLYTYGQWPLQEIDHINQIQNDNRIDNLRLADRSQNCHHTRIRTDNTSGYKGVCWERKCNKWRACISVNKTRLTLGYFKDKIIAAIRYNLAALYLVGDFVALNQLEDL